MKFSKTLGVLTLAFAGAAIAAEAPLTQAENAKIADFKKFNACANTKGPALMQSAMADEKIIRISVEGEMAAIVAKNIAHYKDPEFIKSQADAGLKTEIVDQAKLEKAVREDEDAQKAAIQNAQAKIRAGVIDNVKGACIKETGVDVDSVLREIRKIGIDKPEAVQAAMKAAMSPT